MSTNGAEKILEAAKKHCKVIISPNVDEWELSTEHPMGAVANAAKLIGTPEGTIAAAYAKSAAATCM